MDINNELEMLMSKYKVNIIDRRSELEKIRIAKKSINEIFDSFTDSKTIVIYGAGMHTVELLKSLSEDNKKKIKYIVGNNKIAELKSDIPYLNSSDCDINTIECSAIVISSFKAADEVEDELREKKVNCKVFNIYKELSKKGLKFEYAYYYVTPCETVDIIEIKDKFYTSMDNAEKDYMCRKIISMYLTIRDILHGIQWCEKYISENGLYKERYEAFTSELKKLLSKIRERLNQRKQRDIIINWIDGLRYDEIDKTSYLKSVKESGVFFENAYTVCPATSATLEIIMNGFDNMSAFECGLKNNYSVSNSKFIQELHSVGYNFKYIGLTRMEIKFEKELRPESNLSHERTIATSMTESQWETLNCVLNSSKPICCIVHEVAETHAPHICTELEKKKCEVWNELKNITANQMIIEKKLNNIDNIQIKISRDYVDEQLKWYSEFYGDKLVQIYMSDHGKLAEYRFQEGWLHIMMMVKNKYYLPKRILTMFGINQMSELIKDIVCEKNIDVKKCQKINVMWIPLYAIRDFKNMPDDSKKLCLQFIGVVTDEDKYIQFDYGEELYLRLDDENNNLIDSTSYQDRIKELKASIEEQHKCIDVYTNEYYKAAKLLNESLGITKGEKLFGKGKYC